jgi:hypothetical protein
MNEVSRTLYILGSAATSPKYWLQKPRIYGDIDVIKPAIRVLTCKQTKNFAPGCFPLANPVHSINCLTIAQEKEKD